MLYNAVQMQFPFYFRAALDIQKSLDAPLHQMKALVKKWSLKFHERHYLVILVSLKTTESKPLIQLHHL